MDGSLATLRVGGWFFVVSAALAWWTGGAMTLEHAFGRTIIGLLKCCKAANVPGRAATRPISYPAGMPGVRAGQCQAWAQLSPPATPGGDSCHSEQLRRPTAGPHRRSGTHCAGPAGSAANAIADPG